MAAQHLRGQGAQVGVEEATRVTGYQGCVLGVATAVLPWWTCVCVVWEAPGVSQGDSWVATLGCAVLQVFQVTGQGVAPGVSGPEWLQHAYAAAWPRRHLARVGWRR